MADPLVALNGVSVAYNGVTVLRNVSWALHTGEHWAFSGPNGSGKSTLLKLIRGEIWPAPGDGGTRIYALDGAPTRSPIGVGRHIALVSAEQQTRYLRTEWELPVWQVVFTGLHDSDLVLTHPTPGERARVDAMLTSLDIANLSEQRFRTLSQGQLRKVLIARALVRAPRILICDEIGVGLDPAARTDLMAMIEQVARRDTQILLVSHRREEWIPSINRELRFDAGRVQSVAPGRLPSATRHAPSASAQPPLAIGHLPSANGHPPPAIELRNASVAVDAGRLRVLHDMNWTVRQGEHWFVSGPNGAGKTTLMRLLLGEYAVDRDGHLARFGETGGNVWDLKRRIGYVSPELQVRYAHNLPARDVVATGFNASVGWLQPVSRAERKRVDATLERLGIASLAKRGLREMSYGQARKVLLARALVIEPKMLLLDEVFDGLDAGFRDEIGRVLEAEAAKSTIILVSHYAQDRLPWLTHSLHLLNGRIAQMWPHTEPLPTAEGLGVGPNLPWRRGIT